MGDQKTIQLVLVFGFLLSLVAMSLPLESLSIDNISIKNCISMLASNLISKDINSVSVNQSGLKDIDTFGELKPDDTNSYNSNNLIEKNHSIEHSDLNLSTDQDCNKEKRTIDGKLMILHTDNYDDNEYTESYSLIPSDNDKLVTLYPTKKLDIPSGSNVSVTGFVLNNSIYLDNNLNSTDIRVQHINEDPNFPFEGDLRAAAILVNLGTENDSSVNNTLISDSLSQLSNYYSINSANRFSLQSDIFGPYDLTIMNETSPFCPMTSETALKTFVDNVSSISDPDIQFPEYNFLILLSHYSGEYCNKPGLAWNSIDVTTNDTANGKINMDLSFIRLSPESNSSSLLSVIGHEIGHNIVIGHANALECKDKSLPQSSINYWSQCSIEGELDPYDIMGLNNNYHLNAPHLETLGWLSPTNIRTLTDITEQQRFALRPIETITDELKILKIQRDFNDFLYLEFRQPIAFNETSGYHGDIFEGSLIHASFPFRNSTQSLLIDATPDNSSNANFYNSTLKLDDTFIDPLTNITINVVGINQNPTELLVEVGPG